MTDEERTAHRDESPGPDEWLAQLDPAVVAARDASHLRTIIDANTRLASAEQALRGAIRAARSAGDSWTAIAAALGLTPPQALDRFGAVDEETTAPGPVEAGALDEEFPPLTDAERAAGEARLDKLLAQARAMEPGIPES